ncbi:hypothetical protein [Trujillonella endophytica]|uniref:Uncharacterized protein n=1 Tax=Trujillonella endophytica TaxID=673521 RepID=A0A1H8VIZ9_9ACTN|nr:hypothetical protein [Trujillella endophytica]SEP15395.1 hypothetical protein SAMN05660991_03592 [Trujillella endophytica]
MDDGAPRADVVRTIGSAVVVALVLGVLPVALDAPAVWRVLGPVVGVVFAAHAIRVLWRHAFSTAPPHRPRRS